MPKIHLLPPQISILVAAGEVVDRPRAVAKELVENAIDAGAKRITVESRKGGVELIRVTDDGCGIEPGDARTAFLRHATSKIRTESDLLAIGTLGFRGEALAAIAAVSRVDLITRTEGQALGVQLVMEGGEEQDCYETGCPKGTTVAVRDLFYNLPARAKFVKTDQTESNQIESVVNAAALSRPDIAFTYIRDGRQAFATQGDGKLLHAIHAVCGKELAGQLIAAAGDYNSVQVGGFVSVADVGRASRNMQYFFINGRPVRSPVLSSAVDQAYKGKVVAGRHSACFLNITLSPTAVDVNIHPAKAEVRFSNEKAVFSSVYHCIMNSLEVDTAGEKSPREDNLSGYQQEIHVGPSYTIPESMGAVRKVASSPMLVEYQRSRTPDQAPAGSGKRAPSYPGLRESLPGAGERYIPDPSVYVDDGEARDAAAGVATAERQAVATGEAGRAAPSMERGGQGAAVEGQISAGTAGGSDNPEPQIPVRVIGEAFQTYVIAQDEQGLWLIDKHAAQEKILYDRLVQQTGNIPGQLLLSPQKISLTPEEKALILENGEALEKAGFAVEDFGVGTVLVRQIPAYLEEGDVTYVLSDLAQKWSLQQTGFNAVYDNLLKSIACRSAIKAGHESTVEELQRFAGELLSLPEVRNCPHGRPVAASLTRDDIEKMFRRKI